VGGKSFESPKKIKKNRKGNQVGDREKIKFPKKKQRSGKKNWEGRGENKVAKKIEINA
jgi:hypothetical protein